MKAIHFKKAVCAALAGLVLALSGCGRSGYIDDDKAVLHVNSVAEIENAQPQAVVNENGSVTAVEIVESGGEDGRVNEWKVYRENGKAVLSFMDRFSQEPELFEISEEEYHSVMSFGFAESIAKYEKHSSVIIYDEIYFDLTFTYENGETLSARADIYDLVSDLYRMLVKYRELQASADESIEQGENDRPVKATFIESGGLGGTIIRYEVYELDGRFLFAYSSSLSDAPEVYTINDKDFNAMMSIDYEKEIIDYAANSYERPEDTVNYTVFLVYENGEEISGAVGVGDAAGKFWSLAEMYMIGDEIDY